MTARVAARCGLAGLVALAAAWSTSSLAEPRERLGHGRELSRDIVGPEAISMRAPVDADGATISDLERPSYARLVPDAADYDGLAVRGPHLLIENVTIRGALDISTKLPVVLRAVTVMAPRALPWLVLVRPGAGALHVLWSDIGGARLKRSASPYVGVALALRSDGARIHRSRIGAAADGVQITGRDTRITESVIADLLSRRGDHNDAVQVFDDAAKIEIALSRIENAHPQTSAITVLGRDVTIRSNLIAGGGWSIYGGARRNGKGGGDAAGVRITDNVFSRAHFPKVGSFGPLTYWSAGNGNVWTNNRLDDGEPVQP